jgi:hypothetical protein
MSQMIQSRRVDLTTRVSTCHGLSRIARATRAGDAPDFSSLQARVRETQGEVRRVFLDVVEGGG